MGGSTLVGYEPQGRPCWLDRAADRGEQVVAQGLELDVVAQPCVERGDAPFGIVGRPVEPAVDAEL